MNEDIKTLNLLSMDDASTIRVPAVKPFSILKGEKPDEKM